MRWLITGADGFLGRNLRAELATSRYEDITVDAFDRLQSLAELEEFVVRADAIIHLAGVNRPENESEFMEGNRDFVATLLELLAKHHKCIPLVVTSSIQAELDNPYGLSKRAGEALFTAYAQQSGSPLYLYRLPNVFGKWCRPHYNSAVATFCYQIAHHEEINIRDRHHLLTLVYVDDVIRDIIQHLQLGDKPLDITPIQPTYQKTLGEIADLLASFYQSRLNLTIPSQEDEFTRKLYATYLSYLPEDQFSYPLTTHADARGSFSEFLKDHNCGQVSINVIHPGYQKGNHWHHTKNEKFLTIAGTGEIRFRRIGTQDVISYPVSAKRLEVVDIPPGYTHAIINTGHDDMVLVMWANEPFDPENPDTNYEEVSL